MATGWEMEHGTGGEIVDGDVSVGKGESGSGMRVAWRGAADPDSWESERRSIVLTHGVEFVSLGLMLWEATFDSRLIYVKELTQQNVFVISQVLFIAMATISLGAAVVMRVLYLAPHLQTYRTFKASTPYTFLPVSPIYLSTMLAVALGGRLLVSLSGIMELSSMFRPNFQGVDVFGFINGTNFEVTITDFAYTCDTLTGADILAFLRFVTIVISFPLVLLVFVSWLKYEVPDVADLMVYSWLPYVSFVLLVPGVTVFVLGLTTASTLSVSLFFTILFIAWIVVLIGVLVGPCLCSRYALYFYPNENGCDDKEDDDDKDDDDDEGVQVKFGRLSSLFDELQGLVSSNDTKLEDILAILYGLHSFFERENCTIGTSARARDAIWDTPGAVESLFSTAKKFQADPKIQRLVALCLARLVRGHQDDLMAMGLQGFVLAQLRSEATGLRTAKTTESLLDLLYALCGVGNPEDDERRTLELIEQGAVEVCFVAWERQSTAEALELLEALTRWPLSRAHVYSTKPVIDKLTRSGSRRSFRMDQQRVLLLARFGAPRAVRAVNRTKWCTVFLLLILPAMLPIFMVLMVSIGVPETFSERHVVLAADAVLTFELEYKNLTQVVYDGLGLELNLTDHQESLVESGQLFEISEPLLLCNTLRFSVSWLFLVMFPIVCLFVASTTLWCWLRCSGDSRESVFDFFLRFLPLMLSNPSHRANLRTLHTIDTR